MDQVSLTNTSISNTSLTIIEGDNETAAGTVLGGGVAKLSWANEKRAMYLAGMVFHIFFLGVGLFGNVMSVIILKYKPWNHIVSKNALIALAVSDTIMITTQFFNFAFIREGLPVDVRAFSIVGCKFFFIVYRTGKMTSSWFVVLLCIDRFIAVTIPMKAKVIVTRQRVNIYIAINYIVMVGFNISRSFATTVHKNTCKNHMYDSSDKVIFRALSMTGLVLFTVLPVGLVSSLTPFIIAKLVQQHEKRKALSKNRGKESEQSRRNLHELIRTSSILVSVVVTFIVCIIPVSIFQQMKFWYQYKKSDMETTYSIYMFREIAQCFEKLNYCINFFLYIVSSTAFRSSFLELLHIGKNRQDSTSLGQTETSNVRNKSEVKKNEPVDSEKVSESQKGETKIAPKSQSGDASKIGRFSDEATGLTNHCDTSNTICLGSDANSTICMQMLVNQTRLSQSKEIGEPFVKNQLSDPIGTFLNTRLEVSHACVGDENEGDVGAVSDMVKLEVEMLPSMSNVQPRFTIGNIY